MVDFSDYKDDRAGWCIQPSQACIFTSHKPFLIWSILYIALYSWYPAAETTGATTAVWYRLCIWTGYQMEELQGSLAVDGFSSAISGCFGCLPLTSFSQNIGLVTMTGVINRFTILMGALILILASLFPPLGAFFNFASAGGTWRCTL